MNFKTAKGVKDWYGREAILRNDIKNKLRTVFERYGYNPIETPMIETTEALGFKGGGEIQKEVFKVSDQGGRDLALRFDHTVPLARFYATHNDIRLPFKRYAIGEVFRDGPTQIEQGRYRIFTQCDIDVLGIKDMTAEVELFALARDAFNSMGLGNVDVKINNRKLLDSILDYCNVPASARTRTIVALDKMDKIGAEGVQKELLEMRMYAEPLKASDESLQIVRASYEKKESLSEDTISKLIAEIGEDGLIYINNAMKSSKDLNELYSKIGSYKDAGKQIFDLKKIEKLSQLITKEETNESTYKKILGEVGDNEGLGEIRQLLDHSKNLGFDFIQFDPALARGLDYYTGTTIEVYLQNKDIIKSAIVAGGRFDNMVGEFRGQGVEVPAVGVSFGLERLVMVLDGQNIGARKNTTDIYMIPIGDTTDKCMKACQDLRQLGLNVDMHQSRGKRVKDILSYVNDAGIPYAGFFGENEVQNNQVTLKNMMTGNQKTLGITEVKYFLDDK